MVADCFRRVNPFDQFRDEVERDELTDDSAFCQNFTVRFLGSMEVRSDRG